MKNDAELISPGTLYVNELNCLSPSTLIKSKLFFFLIFIGFRKDFKIN